MKPIILVTMTMFFCTAAFSQSQEDVKRVTDECIDEVGAPKPNSGLRPTEEEKMKVQKCVEFKKSAIQARKSREAYLDCARENNVLLVNGQPASLTYKNLLENCMERKGFPKKR